MVYFVPSRQDNILGRFEVRVFFLPEKGQNTFILEIVYNTTAPAAQTNLL